MPISRRALVAIVALMALAGASTALAFWLDQRAEHRVAVEAANETVLADVADRYRALRDTTAAGADAATALRITLEEHLTVSDRSDEQLASDRAEQQEALATAGRELQRIADQPAPEAPPLADPSDLADELERLATIEQAATELGQRYVEAATASHVWGTALAELRAQAQRYVETVENQPETHDPERLQQLWEEEKAVLSEYRAAAEAAADVPGLAPLAEAYLAYIDANVAFADEVIGLLGQGDIEAYNRRLRETFESDDDPFGFQAAIEQATDEALDRGVIETLAELRSTATDLLTRLEDAIGDVAPTPVVGPTRTPTLQPS